MGKKLVDMDGTLIDSAMRINMEHKVALEYGLTAEMFWEGRRLAEEKYGPALSNYRKLYAGCKEILPDLDEKIVEEWLDVARTPMLYSDTLNFLASFPKEELILFTAGEPGFQNIKIDANGLRDKFSSILILPSPKANNFHNPEPGMIYLDDAPREIDAMRLRHPSVYCIQVREPSPWERQRSTRRKHRYAWDMTEAITIIKEREKGEAHA